MILPAKYGKAENIVILTHEVPDGDAIGSGLAMLIALRKLGKEVDFVVPDCPAMYDFLPNFKDMVEEGRTENYDLAIAIDCADIKRLNGFVNYFENAKVKIVIDHHSSNTMFGDYNFVNPVSPASTQILITLLEYLGVEIDADIGTCIITGIITDTGGFKYPSVTAETFEFAAELKNKGVNISEVYRRVLEVMSRKRFEITRIAVDRMEFLENGKIAFTYITKHERDELELNTGDHEGIVERGRAVEGVEVSIFLRETAEGEYKASFRSNEYVNVADICLMLGGGGHPRAAGCTLNLPLEQAKDKVISETKIHLK